MDKLVNEDTLKLVVNYIEDISSKLESIDTNVLNNLLFLNHAFIVCNIVYNILDGLKRKGKIPEIPFLIGFVCAMATGLGGAALSSLLRAKPQIIFFNDVILVFFLCAWILILYFPFGLIRRILSFPLFELVFYAFEGYFVSDIVLRAMNDAAIDFPTSNFTPIIIGVLSANGGMILRPFILNQYLGEPFESTVLSNPNIVFKASLILCSFYFISTHVMFLESYRYVFQQGKTSIAIDITPKLVFQASFVLLWLIILLNSFVVRFSRSPPAKAKKLQSTVASEQKSPGTSKQKSPDSKLKKKKQ